MTLCFSFGDCWRTLVMLDVDKRAVNVCVVRSLDAWRSLKLTSSSLVTCLTPKAFVFAIYARNEHYEVNFSEPCCHNEHWAISICMELFLMGLLALATRLSVAQYEHLKPPTSLSSMPVKCEMASLETIPLILTVSIGLCPASCSYLLFHVVLALRLASRHFHAIRPLLSWMASIKFGHV